MKYSTNSSFMPITIVIEAIEEAEVLHKILGQVSDDTEEQIGMSGLYYHLGRQLNPEGAKFRVTGELTLKDR